MSVPHTYFVINSKMKSMKTDSNNGYYSFWYRKLSQPIRLHVLGLKPLIKHICQHSSDTFESQFFGLVEIKNAFPAQNLFIALGPIISANSIVSFVFHFLHSPDDLHIAIAIGHLYINRKLSLEYSFSDWPWFHWKCPWIHTTYIKEQQSR